MKTSAWEQKKDWTSNRPRKGHLVIIFLPVQIRVAVRRVVDPHPVVWRIGLLRDRLGMNSAARVDGHDGLRRRWRRRLTCCHMDCSLAQALHGTARPAY